MNGRDLHSVVAEIEIEVLRALDTLDYSPLNVLGNGEFTVVLGWPTDAPELVYKPMGPYRPDECDNFESTVADYMTELRRRGVGVVDTELVRIDRPGAGSMSYMVQPLLPREELAEHALTDVAPDAEHPLLVGVAEAVATCDGTIGIDAPISNWRFDGESVELLDVGLPMLWDAKGGSQLDLDAVGDAFPAPLRRPLVREVVKILERYRDPRVAGVEFVGRLPAYGLQAWCEPAASCMNAHLGTADPITVAEAEAMMAEDTKTIPLLKRMQRLQRTWERRVRRRRYEYFIGEANY